jgi:hypothetical protein
MTTYNPIEDGPRDLAFLYLVATLVPAIFAEPAETPIRLDRPGWVAVAVLGIGLVLDVGRAVGVSARSTRQLVARSTRRARVPGRGLVLWGLDLISREPPIDPAQARESLARVCGYRLHGEGYRVVSVVPSLHRWRVGVWVTIARPSAFTKRWECRYVRWIDDPHELWLLRSALRGTTAPRAVPGHRPGAIALDDIDADEIDELLGGPPQPGSSKT